jgi:pilus assembly protein CpaB
MKRRLIFFMITALIAVLIVMLINSALKTKQKAIEALQHGQVQIAVAAQALPLGKVVDAAGVKLVAWPRDNLPPGAITDLHQVRGQVLKQNVIENQPIVSSMLLERGKTGGVLPFLIPNGMRAMSIPVTPVSDMAGMILPHTRVDVLVTSGEGNGQADRTRIVLQDVEVLAAQTTLDAPGNDPQHAEVVTLLVTPGDAERLAAAIRLGTLQIAMRSYGDQQPIWTTGVDSRQLLGLPPSIPPVAQSPVISAPRKAGPRPQPPWGKTRSRVSVEIMRNGKERQTVNFERISPALANPETTSAVDPVEANPAQDAAPAQ